MPVTEFEHGRMGYTVSILAVPTEVARERLMQCLPKAIDVAHGQKAPTVSGLFRKLARWYRVLFTEPAKAEAWGVRFFAVGTHEENVGTVSAAALARALEEALDCGATVMYHDDREGRFQFRATRPDFRLTSDGTQVEGDLAAVSVPRDEEDNAVTLGLRQIHPRVAAGGYLDVLSDEALDLDVFTGLVKPAPLSPWYDALSP